MRTSSASDAYSSETTAHALAYAILLMALYPDFQAKLREESFCVWPTLDDIQASTYKRDFGKFVRSSLTSTIFPITCLVGDLY